jgi:hypothetical protein
MKQLLRKMKAFIEDYEVSVEAIRGDGRSLEQLLYEKAMPSLYYEVCLALEVVNDTN